MTAAGYGIDRRSLVDRHAVTVEGIVAESPLSVGNGELCFTVDVTGLQTFPEQYPVASRGGAKPGTLLGTQTQWAWHSSPGGEQHDLSRTRRTYHTPRGPVRYVDMRGDLGAGNGGEVTASPTETWLRNNPHRLDLARIGLVAATDRAIDEAGAAPRPPELPQQVHQRLDLWTGSIESRYVLSGTPVAVWTVCHPTQDVIGVRLQAGGLLASGRLGLRIAFPYGSEEWGNAAQWRREPDHASELTPDEAGYRVLRTLDTTRYLVRLRPSEGARVTQVGRHDILISTDRPVLELAVEFGPDGSVSAAPGASYQSTAAAARDHWPRFWSSGAAVDLADSTDERALELERRTVLSQYLTAIHCAGSLPPQETGLMLNSWRGRFHLEMHWWHGAHFPLWGRSELLERSLDWYVATLPQAQEIARSQGYAGARWPKQVGPDGRESPSPIGPFLIWQQPHPIVLAELVRRATGGNRVPQRYAEVVLESAAFMADFAVATGSGYQLGPPLVPAQESYAGQRAELTNPTFELAYWQWGLRIAAQWRELLGLPPAPGWAAVAERLAPPMVRDGQYAAIDVPPYTIRADHPSMLLAMGLVPPGPMIEREAMRATLHGVLADWDWSSTWGWDYPAMAMTATWLGEPETALRALLWPAEKNHYLPNGHNRQSGALPIYLPGNGGLLTAVALMTRGGERGTTGPSPGFPDDGSWRVRHEGLCSYPGNPPDGH